MWRNKKKKKKKKNKANVKIGSIGGGNVGLGNASAGVTTLSSLVTNIGTSGATTVNIGSTGTTGSSMVNIGLGATGINIGTGSTGTVTIGNANGTVRLNGPLTLGSAPSSGSTASAPYLGSYYIFNIAPVSITGTDNLPTPAVPIPSPGIWLINYQIRIKPGISVATITRIQTEVFVSGASIGGMIENSSTQNISGSQFVAHNGFAIATVTNSTSTVTVTTAVSISVGPVQTDTYSFIKIMRIA